MTDYLVRNSAFARCFIGQRISSVVRLLGEVEEDPPRVAWGPALVELASGSRFMFDCEESLSNLIVNELPNTGPLWDAVQRRPVRPAIATAAPADPLHVLLTKQVIAVDAISRPYEPPPGMRRYYEMCGWRLDFGESDLVCIGTHLTVHCVPSTAFYLPSEVDQRLSYAPLARLVA